MNLTPIIMDLKAKRDQLLKERETLEKIKKEAHEGILKINADLRKLAALTRHAEEMFAEEKEKV